MYYDYFIIRGNYSNNILPKLTLLFPAVKSKYAVKCIKAAVFATMTGCVKPGKYLCLGLCFMSLNGSRKDMEDLVLSNGGTRKRSFSVFHIGNFKYMML